MAIQLLVRKAEESRPKLKKATKDLAVVVERPCFRPSVAEKRGHAMGKAVLGVAAGWLPVDDFALPGWNRWTFVRQIYPVGCLSLKLHMIELGLLSQYYIICYLASVQNAKALVGVCKFLKCAVLLCFYLHTTFTCCYMCTVCLIAEREQLSSFLLVPQIWE